MLVLSGGGSHGAFGAGVLYGWSEQGTRPAFDVVTGVSTGALMATYAFLGRAYDPELERFYTKVTTDQIYVPRTPLLRFFGSSLHSTRPLEGLLARTIDEPILEEVADAYRSGRGLFVASTNLDTGELTIWDLGKIASSDRPAADRLQAYRSALLASASIPVFFPPVYVEVEGDSGGTFWQMHVDGAAKAPLFFRNFMSALNAAAEASGVMGGLEQSRMWVVVNGAISREPARVPVEPSLLAIASSSVGVLFDEQQSGHIYRLYRRAADVGYDFNIAFVPPTYNLFDAKVFEPDQMRDLFERGRRSAIMGTVWRNEPPGLEASERVGFAVDGGVADE
ncbi:MAG: patatin-like phospholipase family protein [Planctomycetota bacterium]